MSTAGDTPLLQGLHAGRFEVIREIGRGGVAVVYLARQHELARHVALKELSAVHARDPAFAGRFLREAHIAGSLSHPNIVPVYDYFEHDGVPYIAMEYLPNGSLRPHVGKLGLAQTAGVMDALLSALSFACEKGVVHRDLKPENLLLGVDGVVKVTDFGVAKALHAASDSSATVTGMTVGTPSYMAPEQALGRNVGSPADVYGAGIVAYELLVGTTPFHDTDNQVATLYRHVHEAPPAPRSLDPTIDPRLEEWVLGLLAKDPDERPQAADAREALEEFMLSEFGPRWRRDARIGPIDTTPAPEAPAAGPAPATTVPDADRSSGGQTSNDDGRFHTYVPRRRRQASQPNPVLPVVAPEPAPAAVTARERQTGDTAVVTPPAFVAVSPDVDVEPVAAPGMTIADVPTAPPTRVPPELTAPVAPSPSPRRRRRLAVGIAVGLVATGVTAVTLVGLGEDDPGPPPTATVVPDLIPTERADLAVAGGNVIVTQPQGQVIRLAGRPLAPEGSVRNPISPRAAVAGDEGVYVADATSVTLRKPATLQPIWVRPTGPGTTLAISDATGPVVAFADGSNAGKVCGITAAGALQPCVTLPFTPSGVGVSGDTVFVADEASDSVATFRRNAVGFREGSPITVGNAPHSRIPVAPDGRVYVPIERGLAVIDPATGVAQPTIALPTTPSDVVVDANGAVFAALPGSNRIAIIDSRRPADAPRLVDVGDRPVAVAVDRAAGTVFAFSEAENAVVAIDATTGTPGPTATLPALPSAGSPVTLTRVSTATSGLTRRMTFALSGPVDPAGFKVTGTGIAKGSTTFEVWQSGITSTARPDRTGLLRVDFGERPGRVIVRLRATPGRFSRSVVKLAPNGRSVVLTLTEVPPAPPTGGGGGGGGGGATGGGTTPSGGGGGTTPGGGGGGGGGGGNPPSGGGGGGGGGGADDLIIG